MPKYVKRSVILNDCCPNFDFISTLSSHLEIGKFPGDKCRFSFDLSQFHMLLRTKGLNSFNPLHFTLSMKVFHDLFNLFFHLNSTC